VPKEGPDAMEMREGADERFVAIQAAMDRVAR
jgi:hypothetical protein